MIKRVFMILTLTLLLLFGSPVYSIDTSSKNLDKYTKKISNKFHDARCIIIPYLKDENLNLIHQALNYEIPIIGTNLNEISKIIPKEFLAKPKDINSLQSVIKEIIPLLSQLDLSAIKKAIIENY